MRKVKRQKGFTLVELIIVVIILAILVGLAVPQYLNVVRRGREAEGWAGLAFIRSAQARYLVEYDTYGDKSKLTTYAEFPPDSTMWRYGIASFDITTFSGSASPTSACTGCRTLTITEAGVRNL